MNLNNGNMLHATMYSGCITQNSSMAPKIYCGISEIDQYMMIISLSSSRQYNLITFDLAFLAITNTVTAARQKLMLKSKIKLPN